MKRQYRLLYNTSTVDYSGSDRVEIGKIIDSITEKDVMYILYDKNLWGRWGYHTCIEEYEYEGIDYPVAIVDDLHKSCLYEHGDVFLALMLHELGHYINGDLTSWDGEQVDNETVRERRLVAIQNGKVQTQELKADAFSVQYVGKNTFMRAMDYMIKMREKRGDDGAALAIKEFELRKKAVQKLK